MALERYRDTMDIDVVRSWATDAQSKLDALSGMLTALRQALNDSYESSPEGRVVLKEIDRILEM